MDSSQWPQPQVIGIESLKQKPIVVEKKPRPPKEQALNCPRCNSTNTKFCYYNNYSLSQPRYFCKNCRRYWTEGGSLRNVPVGGGSRKNKRCSSSSSSITTSSSSKKLAQDLPFLSTNPKIQQGQDLNLAYDPNLFLPPSSLTFGLDAKANPTSKPSSLDLLNFGQNSYIPHSIGANSSVYCPSFPGFTTDQNVYGGSSNPSRLVFPFDELKTNEFRNEEGNGYWNGVLDGGSW